MNTCVSRLGYLGLEVRDLDAWTEFGTSILGMQQISDAGGRTCFLRMDENHHRIALHAGERDDLAYAGWEVEDPTLLKAVADRLTSRGASITWATEEESAARRVARHFVTHDPDGVRNEVFSGLRPGEGEFTSPRGVESFATRELGMGHYVLMCGDVEASARFYTEGLGLKVSDYIDLDMGDGSKVEITFLHAGPRHHSVALLPMKGPTRLHHLMVEADDLDDVGRTYDLCRANGVPIAMSLGRHTNDRMTSFYMKSPAGFQVEVGHGGVAVDDESWQVERYDAASIWGHQTNGV